MGYYKEYDEAKRSAQQLGVTGAVSYRQLYKEDLLLPSNPAGKYPEWTGWADFVGKSSYGSKYKTYQEASAATQELEIQSKQEYDKRYKEDPQLPSAPNKSYTDWVSWWDFLGIETIDYYSFEEAAVAAQRLVITGMKQYRKRYAEDERLPSNPERTYEGEWRGWMWFLGKE